MIKLGQLLHDKRIQKGLTIDDVTRDIKIRPAFIRAIEKGEYHKLPASSYAQGFIANYADYLGLSKRETLAIYRREFDDAKVYQVLPERMTDPAQAALSRFRIQHTTVIIIIAFLVFVLYLGYSYKDAFINPSLSIKNIEGSKIKAGSLTIEGKANPYDTVTINNQPVYLNSDGTFSKSISVFTGKFSLSIRATNRFGRVTTIEKVFEAKE